MSKAKIAPLGLIKSESSATSDSNILWSSGKRWDGLIIEQHHFLKRTVTEFKVPDYSLIIQLLPPPAKKHKIKKLQHINDFAEICLLPKGLPAHRPCLHHRQEILVLTLSPEVVKRAAHELRVNLSSGLAEHHQVSDAQVEHIGMALKTEAEDGYLSGRLYGESLGTALSVHLLSKYSVLKPEDGNHKGGMTPPNLSRVIEYIHDNLTEDIGLSQLAKVANLSQFRFAHNFKQATGLAPHQYVIRERLERAKHLLRETDLTVTAIAYAVGCGSPSRFTLLFRRANGVNPSVYRASFR
jgi:AraC family transcriptional regulator